MFSRINFYAVLAVLLAVTVSYQMVFRKFSELSRQTQLAKAEYQSALTFSQVQLASRLRHLASDQVLEANLDWGLKHSVKKELEGHLEAFHLEELQIVRPNCEVVVHVALSQKHLDRCALAIASSKQIGQFIWNSSTEGPVLLLVLPLKSRETAPLFIAGIVSYNQNWLASQPGMITFVENLDLSIPIEASQATPLINSTPSLATGNFWLAAIPAIRFGTWQTETPFLFYILILSLALVLGILWHQDRVAKQANANDQQSFLVWLKSQVGSGTPDGGAGACEDGSVLTYGHARCWVEGLLAHHTQQLRDLKLDNSSMRRKLEEQKVQVASLVEQLDSASLKGSTADLLVDNNSRIQNLLHELESDYEDLEDIVSHGMRRSIEMLIAILKPWRQEIELRGVRRFWRSLAEKESDRGSSILEDQLAILDQVSGRISDQLINHSVKSQQLRQKLFQLAEIGGRLEQVAAPHQGEVAESAIDVLCSAQDLLAVGSENFSNRFPFEADLLVVPNVPKAMLILSVQSLYRNLLNLEGRKSAIITSIKKDRLGNAIWLLSCEVCASDLKGTQIVSSAANFLKAYSISVEVLPSSEGMVSIAMKWPAGISISGNAASETMGNDLQI